MSGIMKAFVDRLTDLLEIDKDTGRKLRNKRMAVLSTSLGDNLSDDFWLPFMAIARYLGMEYAGHTDVNCSKKASKQEGLNNLQDFALKITVTSNK